MKCLMVSIIIKLFFEFLIADFVLSPPHIPHTETKTCVTKNGIDVVGNKTSSAQWPRADESVVVLSIRLHNRQILYRTGTAKIEHTLECFLAWNNSLHQVGRRYKRLSPPVELRVFKRFQILRRMLGARTKFSMFYEVVFEPKLTLEILQEILKSLARFLAKSLGSI